MTVRARIGFLRELLKQRFDVGEYEELHRLEAIVRAVGGASTVTRVDPATAVVGGPDETLHIYGTGFTAETVILFNHGEEPTTYVAPTEVTTLLKPSTASGPVTVPVSVVGAETAVDFTFTTY